MEASLALLFWRMIFPENRRPLFRIMHSGRNVGTGPARGARCVAAPRQACQNIMAGIAPAMTEINAGRLPGPGRTGAAARPCWRSVLHDRHVGHRGGGLVVMAAVGAAVGQDAVILDLEVRAVELALLLVGTVDGLG